MDTTKHIEDLILSDFEADAIRLATVGGPSALASFVLDYIRVAVDWRSLANNLQTRGVELEHQEQSDVEEQRSSCDLGGPETG